MMTPSIRARIVALAAKAVETLEFYTPNPNALKKALVQAGSNTTKPAWKKIYRSARESTAKGESVLKTHVTIKASNGKIYRGPSHGMAALDLLKERPADYDWLTRTTARAERASGFATTMQPHVTYKEGTRLAKRQGWKSGDEPWRKKARPGLHSSDLKNLPGK